VSDIVIRVEGLGKRYRIGKRERYLTLTDSFTRSFRSVLNFFKYKDKDEPKDTNNHIWALKDISFKVKKGEIIGIIGNNGAGKSTFLKILSRITEPTEGYAEIYGRVGSLLEVGTGFHPELTGRENIYLNGAILGMKKAEIERKFDDIVDFAEIEKFLDTPVKYYSSGMYVRLAFAVAAHLEPEILLVDEVLAVGDASFQKKCLGKMGEVAREGRTVLFVSHNMGAIKSLCNRGILLENGNVSIDGSAPNVVDRYMLQNLGTPITRATFPEDSALRIQLLNAELVPHISPQREKIICLKCTYIVRKKSENMMLCVEVRTPSDVSVFYANDSYLSDNRKRNVGIHTVTLSIPSYLLAPGEYLVAFGFWEPGHAAEHFPDVRLTFRKEEPISRLSSHGIEWPSVIYMSPTWNYVANNDDFTRDDAL
jgi:lipopolysaccharide transport system ATP-binding protein